MLNAVDTLPTYIACQDTAAQFIMKALNVRRHMAENEI